jgi:four helix bundle protein
VLGCWVLGAAYCEQWRDHCLVLFRMAKDFTELAAWQLADELRRLILEIAATPTVARDFRYCDQCKDAARSAASNIAEGFGRYKHREFARFLRIAMGSLKEVADLLIDGHERSYVSDAQLAAGLRLAKRSKSACARLAEYLDRTPDRN